MSFAYTDYLMNNLMLPLFALVFIAVPLVRFLSRIFANVFRGENVYLGSLGTTLILIALILIAAVLIYMLFNGGIYLIFEHGNDAVTAEGTIEEIQKLNALQGVRYASNGETTFGYEFTVDGITCVGMAVGSFQEGDEVTITYLPKSGFLLEIQPANS